MRKTITLFLIMLFVFSMAGFANAEPANITEALATANDELRAKFFGENYFLTQNIQGKPINEANWAKNKLFTYGTPQEASPRSNDFDPGTNQYRYHGYTRNGEKYTNTFFRNDTTETVDVNSANWIPKPWNNPAVQNFVTDGMHEPALNRNNPFNNDPALLKSIVLGLENVTQYNPYIKFQRDNTQWQSFVHILQPPSGQTFGMGRLFRQVGGQMRYLTIPLTPLSFDRNLVAVSIETGIPAGQMATIGQRYTGTITFRNESNEALTAPVGVWHNGYPLKLKDVSGIEFASPGAITFGQKGTPEATKTFTFEYGPVVGSMLLGAVNHAPTEVTVLGESNINDNVVEAAIPVLGYDIKIAITGQTAYKSVSKTIGVKPELRITRKDSIPGNIQAKLTVTGGPGQNNTVTLAPGQTKEIEYSFPAAPGTYTIKVETWPVGLTDIYTPDNTAQITIVVTKGDQPPNDREIRTGLGGR